MFVMSLRLGAVLLAVQLCGCVAGEVERRVAPEDTAWIQKDQTTREHIIEKFGEPNLTMPSRGDDALGQYAIYGQARMPDTYSAGGVSSPFEPRPRGATPQAYRPPIESIEAAAPKAELDQPFWVLYDAQGIVRDYGFGKLPTEQETSWP